jgi:methylase of polypeptide subunit release factors
MRPPLLRSKLRKTRSYSLDAEVVAQIERTKGEASASERVNHLLRYALEMERKASLAEEAAKFFASKSRDREEHRAFRKISFRCWTR